MRRGLTSFVVGVVSIGIASFVWSAEKLVAHSGALKAYMNRGECAEEIRITVRSSNPTAFQGDKVELQKLMGGVQAIMGLQCPQAQRFVITGEVGGSPLYAGLIDRTSGGLLVDKTPSMAATSASQTHQAQQSGATAGIESLADHMQPSDQASTQADGSTKVSVKSGLPAPLPLPTEHAITTSQKIGIRNIEPLMIGDRILSGYPIINGKYVNTGGEVKVGMLPRNEIKVRFELGLLADLIVLKQWPAIIDDKAKVFEGQDTKFDNETAYNFASNFLIGDALKKYLSECTYSSTCRPDRRFPYSGWAGTNEFEREASYRSFLKDVRPLLIKMAPELPLKFINIIQVEMQPYDEEKGAFPLKDPHSSKFGILSAASHTAVAKLRITGDYDMPTEVKISRDKAPAFLARLQGQKRTAYLAYDVTLGQPKWDYEIDAPTLTSVWTNPRLYVDADMQQPLYVFNVAPSQKNAEQTAANTAPTSEQSSVEKTGQATLAKVPNFLLLYKYAPNAISEDDLLQREKQQIGQDQWHHKYPKQAGSYVFAFTEAEVKDREVNFAATDLLPVYKQRIAALAQQIPDHVSFKDLVSLRYLVYQDGKIRQNSTSGQGPDVLQKYYLVSPEEELRNYPPLGAHQVFYGGIPELWGAMPTTTIPDSMISLTNGTLALDRILTVPPIAMDAARAEKMWKRPDCLPYPASYRHQGMKPKDAEAAAAECMAERQSYEDGLTLDFDINVEGVVEGKQGWVIKAHVNKVDIYSPRHELLKTIAGADLPPADDVWQRQSDEQAAKQKEEAETQAREAEAQAREQAQKQTLARVEQDRLSAEREKLRNADIIGIRLGMTLSEAEQIIRNHMHVGWVGDLGGKIAPGIKANQPYIQHFRTFINKEGREVVALYWDSKSSDRIVAVTRSLRLPTGASPEDVTAQLLKKYGDQPANKSDRELLWTADFGNQQGQIHDAATYSNSTCSSVLGTIGIIYLKFQDGKDYRSIDKNLFDLIPSPGFIQVDGGQFSDKYGNWQWDSTQWKNCGPAVLAEIQPEDNMGKEYSLVVGLHDLAAYAPLYAAETQEKKNAVDINLNL